MMHVKRVIKSIFSELNWYFACFFARILPKSKSDSFLLVPAGDLNGGFGEDVMVASFIENFCKERNVTIYTSKVIDRSDYLNGYKGVKFVGGFSERSYIRSMLLIKKHSFIYVIGADIIDGAYGADNSIRRLRLMKLAKMLDRDCQISGFSVSNKILNVVKRELTDIAKFTYIKARDIDSYNRLVSFIPKSRVLLTNDIAFLCPCIKSTYDNEDYYSYVTWCKSMDVGMKRIIGVCPNSIQANNIGLNRYIEGLKIVLDGFLEQGRFSFVFLYHDIRPLCDNDNDLTISLALYKHYISKNVDCFFTDKIKNGIELKAYVNKVDFTVTGRMHLGIAGLSSGRPMFGISYANKFEGMLRLFDVDPSSCLVDYTVIEKPGTAIQSFVKTYDVICSNINRHIVNIKKDTLKNFYNE